MNYAKLRFLLLMSSFIALLPSCSDSNSGWSPTNSGSDITGTEAENKSIDKKLFEVINLDYPGLGKVKTYYEAGEYYLAAQSLLNYYRIRTDVVNPLISLLNVTVTANEKKIADDALSYKFYVKNYTDAKGESYQFKAGSDTQINWAYQPVTDGEFRSELYRLAWFDEQGKAYRATGNESYVKSWIEVYGDFWSQYPIPTTNTYDHYGTYGALPVAERVIEASDVFSYFINSSNFTPAWLSTFLTSVAEQVEYI